MPIDMHCHLFVKEFRNESYVAPFWDRGAHTARSLEDALAEAKKRIPSAATMGPRRQGTH